MATVFTPEYSAGQVVWVITTATATCASLVAAGTVVQARGSQLTTGTTIKYDIRLEDENGTTEFPEDQTFADVNAAMTAYSISLGGSPLI